MSNAGVLWKTIMVMVIVLIAMAGCRNVGDTLYIKYADIPAEGWNPAEPVDFNPAPADTSFLGSPMNLILCVRYRIHKPMAELPVLISVEDESGSIINDTVNVRTFAPDGTAIGKGGMGIAEISDTLLRGYILGRDLSVRTASLVAPKLSEGLLNIGIKLTQYEPDSSHSGESL